jgi:hypothetical protein
MRFDRARMRSPVEVYALLRHLIGAPPLRVRGSMERLITGESTSRKSNADKHGDMVILNDQHPYDSLSALDRSVRIASDQQVSNSTRQKPSKYCQPCRFSPMHKCLVRPR